VLEDVNGCPWTIVEVCNPQLELNGKALCGNADVVEACEKKE